MAKLSSSTIFGKLKVIAGLDVEEEFNNPTYATLSDVPNDLPEGTQVYVEDENTLYIEDGT